MKKIFLKLPLLLAFFLILLTSTIFAAEKKADSAVQDRIDKLEKELGDLKSSLGIKEKGENKKDKKTGHKIAFIPDWLGIGLGGQYRIMGNGSNFGWHPAAITDDQRSGSFINQRFRTYLNFFDKKNNNAGVYFQVEIGHNGWGDDREGPKTHSANGAAEVGLELRRGFLWYKPSKKHLLRVGVQNWHDRFGEKPDFKRDWLDSVDAYDSFGAVLANSIWDFNVGGISMEGTFGEKIHYRAGWFLLGSGPTFTGKGAANLFATDLDIEVGKALFGGSIYYLRDKGDYSYNLGGNAPGAAYDHGWDYWLGLRGHIPVGEKNLISLFAIFNHGQTKAPQYIHRGWAFKAAFKRESKVGNMGFQVLYATGAKSTTGGNSFRTIAQSERDNFGSQGYWSYLGLTSPWGPSDVNDLGVGLQNRGLGLLTIQLNYEKKITNFLTAYAAIGWLQSAARNPANNEKDMGFELFAELTWTLTKILSLKTGLSYFVTDKFYKTAAGAKNPDGLYEAYFRMQIEF